MCRRIPLLRLTLITKMLTIIMLCSHKQTKILKTVILSYVPLIKIMAVVFL